MTTAHLHSSPTPVNRYEPSVWLCVDPDCEEMKEMTITPLGSPVLTPIIKVELPEELEEEELEDVPEELEYIPEELEDFPEYIPEEQEDFPEYIPEELEDFPEYIPEELEEKCRLSALRDRALDLVKKARHLQQQLREERETIQALDYDRDDTSVIRPSKKAKKHRTQIYLERAAREHLPVLEDLEPRQRQRFTTALWGVINRTVKQQKKMRTKCGKRRRSPPDSDLYE